MWKIPIATIGCQQPVALCYRFLHVRAIAWHAQNSARLSDWHNQ